MWMVGCADDFGLCLPGAERLFLHTLEVPIQVDVPISLTYLVQTTVPVEVALPPEIGLSLDEMLRQAEEGLQ